MRIRSLVVVGVAALLAVVTGPTSASACPILGGEELSGALQGHPVAGERGGDITAAGGTLVANYSQIGVAIARASSDSFRTSLAGRSTVDGVVDTSQFGVRLEDDVNLGGNDTTIAPPTPAPGNDNLSGSAVGHGPDPRPRGPRHQRRQPVDRRRRHRHRPRLHAPGPRAERRLRQQRFLRRRRAEHGPGRRGTTTTATARTPPAPSRRPRTASASSASRRTSRSPASRPATPPASSSPRPSSARSCGPARTTST